jgi:cytoskeletal protein CcmA (bactofilin family)
MSYAGIGSDSSTEIGSGNDRGTSVVDQHSEVEGTYNTSQDLRVEGRLSGSVNCDGVLFIADGAHVDATVEAASIIVSGQLTGQIRCRGRLEITSTGSVGGEVETASLVIVEGARYEGQITMSTSAGTESQTATTEQHSVSAADNYSLLRRYASGAADPADEAPATDPDDDADQTG